jgi:cytochrome c peroxidase
MLRLGAAVIALSMITAASAWGITVIPPVTLFPLNQIAVPEPPNLFQFVKSKPAAIMLGKALFWDMQVGSDGVQACGSCHFSAGADNRLKNSVNPGFDNTFEVRGPNQTLQPGDFPFHLVQTPDIQSPVLRDFNDIVGSQGVRLNDFLDIVPGSAVDLGAPAPDPVFNVNGVNTRRVTGRQAPSNINAIFNFSNFWDGRAHFEFNGVNPFGTLDPTSGVWFNNAGTLVKQPVAIQFGSLASQATGPPLNETEMSFRGRTFPKLGRKMLNLTPLGRQLVHPQDSELGALTQAVLLPSGELGGNPGLKTSYAQMIRDAFQNKFWDSIRITPDGSTQMEANFSLFWGLAIQLYEATLVSDQTPFDNFLGGDQAALTDQQKGGFNIFFGAGGCSGCHAGSELTSASVQASGFISNSSHALIEPMPVVSGQQIIYDAGFNNTAVRPTTEDIGRGGDSTMVNPLTGLVFPLSFSSLAELQAIGKLGFNSSLFPLGAPATPILPPNIPANFPVANNGSFKVPGLRNVELTAPYFHNGGDMTLQDVVEFYTRGGDFRLANQDNLDVVIAGIPSLQNNPAGQAALVAFLTSFTDERVRNQAAPFDHPEIFVPNGDSVNDTDMIHVPATGMFGLPLAVTLGSSAASPQLAGSTVTFSAATQYGSGGPYEFRFWINSGTGFAIVQDYGAANTLVWSPAAAGAYDIMVDVRTVGSSALREASTKLFYFQILPAAATGVTVTPSLASPQAVGAPVTFTAQGQGGSGPYEYRFWINSGAGFNMVQDYAAANTFVWTPAATGNYDILVDVRNAGSTALREASAKLFFYQIGSAGASGVTITPSLASPQPPGTPITFTAQGQGGSGSYQYRFWLNSGTGFTVVQDYGSSSSFAWTPPATGNYDILVDVRNAGSSAAREASAKLFFYQILPGAGLSVTVAPSLASPQTVGTAISFTAQGLGGSGSYQYRFWVNSGSGFALVQDYSAASSFVWTPAAAGAYDLLVDLRNTGSTALREASAKVFFYQVVPPPATGVSVAPNLASPQPVGTAITFTAQGLGGSGSYEYRFWLNSGTGYNLVRDYAASNTLAWTPAETGNFDILVDVRNAGSTALREASNNVFFYQVQ